MSFREARRDELHCEHGREPVPYADVATFNGIKAIDADGHVMEPNELYDQYLDPKFRDDLEELKLVAESRRAK